MSLALLINKTRAQDLQAIEELLNQSEQEISKDFFKRIKNLKSEESVGIIRNYLEVGRVDLAIEYLERQEDSFYSTFLSVYFAGATAEIGFNAANLLQLARKYGEYNTSLAEIVFNPVTSLTANRIQEFWENTVSFLRSKTRESATYIISQGRENGLNNEQIIERLNKYSGLTLKQIQAIENYEKLLREGSKEALTRVLRDENFDHLLGSNKPLSEKQIDKMVDAYRKNMIVFRAENLARNQSQMIVNNARQEAVKQILNKLNLPDNSIIKEWRSVRDKRVRYTHNHSTGMDGQKVRGIDGLFISPSGARLKHPHDGNAPISETAGCRCRMILTIQQGND